MSNVASVWTDERIETMKKLWSEGVSASIIAQQLGNGISRSAVLGKLFRLEGRAPRQTVTHAKMGTKRARSNQNTPKPRRRSAFHVKRDPNKVTAPKPVPTPPPDEPASLNIKLLDLQDHHCRWAHGNRAPYLFCGHPTFEGTPYCEHHASRCFNITGRVYFGDGPRVKQMEVAA